MTPEQMVAMAVGFVIFAGVSTLWSYHRYKARKLQDERAWRGYQ